MATAKSLADYGSAKVDKKPSANATSTLAAAHYNRLAEDTAAMTRTNDRAVVSFVTIGAPGTVSVASYNSHWGSGASVQPALARSSQGVYTITFASTYTDGLSVVETVAMVAAHAQCSGATYAICQCTVSSSTLITVRIFDAGGSATDVAGATLTAWIR